MSVTFTTACLSAFLVKNHVSHNYIEDGHLSRRVCVFSVKDPIVSISVVVIYDGVFDDIVPGREDKIVV